jgi:hypothetical protein
MLAATYNVYKAGGSHQTIMVWSITTRYSSDDIWPVMRFELGKLDSKGAFGWAFAPAFAFAKAKSQPKGLNTPSAFAQKLLSP